MDVFTRMSSSSESVPEVVTLRRKKIETPKERVRCSDRDDRKAPENYKESIDAKDRKETPGKAESLTKKAIKLGKYPNVRVFTKVEVRLATTTKTYVHGQHFFFKDEEHEQLIVKKSELLDAIQAGISEKMEKLNVAGSAGQPDVQTARASTSMSKQFVTPPRQEQARKHVGACYRCKMDKVVHGKYEIKTEWIGCSGFDGDKGCAVYIHADCLGFPGATEAEVHSMPGWFCKLHRELGRVQRKVKMTKVSSAK